MNIDMTSSNSDNSIYVKDVNENQDFKLKCLGKGKVNRFELLD
jgi:hypothetical protein